MKKWTFTLQPTDYQRIRPKPTLLAYFALLGIFLFSGLSINAQTPFNCDPIFYQVIAGQLNSFDPATSSYTPIGPVNPDYNAIGYNVEDNFIYGIKKGTNNLVRIDATGTMDDLGPVAGISSSGFVRGDFDLAGNLYVTRLNNLYVIDVSASPLSGQLVPITGGNFDAIDFAYINTDNQIYGVGSGANLLKLNPLSGALTSTPLSGPITAVTNGFGAVWTNLDGKFFASHNGTGEIFEMDVNTGISKSVAQGTPTNNNDGASCPIAATSLTEDNPAACSDGIDNDGDGLIDCADSDCNCTPFNCDPIFYQVIAGQLNSFDPATSSYAPIGPVNPDYNAIGYNVEDNFIYGIKRGTNNLVKIDALGIMADLGPVAGIASSGFVRGDFDLAGNLYVTRLNSLYVIDVSVFPLSGQLIPITGGNFDAIDFAYINTDNQIYGVGSGANLLRLDPISGALSSAPLSGPITAVSNGFGAVWTNLDGKFFASHNGTGEIFEMDVTTGISKSVAQGTPTNNNDGASCPIAATFLTEDNPSACSDGIDNDGDGLIDCEDSDCNCNNACMNSNLGVLIAPQPSYTTCAISNNGTLDAIAFNGVPGYTYAWSTGANTASISGLGVGTYTVTVTDTDGCTSETSGTVELHPEGVWLMTSTTASCGNTASGTAHVSAMLGTAPYTYLWSNGQTTDDATGLAPGSHSVTVTDALGCQAVATVNISAGTPISLFTTASYETCSGSADATATVIASNGVAPYSYLWSDGQTTDIAVGLGAGVYSVTVTDTNGCSATATQEVELSPEGIWIMVSGTDADCGVDNGTAHVGVMTGVPPYAFIWDDPAMQTTADPTGLAAGTYTVTVTDSNGCSAVGSVTINTNGTVLTVSINSTNVGCNNLGSATANVANGSGSYTYFWNNGASTQTISNLNEGTYTVDVTDNSSGCFGTASVTIIKDCNMTCDTDPGSLVVNLNSCVDPGTSIAVSAIHIGGNVPAGYQTLYILSSGAGLVIQATNSTPDFSVAGPGSFTIHTLVYDPNTLDLNIIVLGVTTGFDLNALLIQGGGTICASLDITGAPFTLYDNPTVSINGPYTACPGATVQMTANTSGVGLSYSWSASGGSFDNPNSATPLYTMMMPGTYTISLTIIDANGCSASATSEVTVNNALTVEIVPSNTSVCMGSTVDFSTNASGVGLSYMWSATGGTFNDPSSATPTYTMMMPGTYTISVNVTDANGCSGSASTQVTINALPSVSISPMNPSVCAGESVDFTSTASGTGLTYNWTATGGSFDDPSNANPTYTMMMPGTYTITVEVTDANGCTASASTQVTISGAPTVSISPQNTSVCAGGSVNFTSTAMGTGLTYSWTATGGSFDDPSNANPTYTMMMPGTYTITVEVTNASGCVASASTEVTINALPDVSVSPMGNTDVCAGESLIVSATASGAAPLTYSWTATGGSFDDPSSATPTYTMMMPGTYTLTVAVTDANGCSASASLDVTINPTPDVSISPLDASSCGAASIDFTATASGSGGPFTYLWTATGGAFSDPSSATPTYSMMMPGTYTISVEVTNASGCTASASTSVTVYPEITSCSAAVTSSYFEGVDISTLGGSDGSASASVVGGTAPFTYLWSDGQTTQEATGLSAGTYMVTINDAGGCSCVASVTLMDPAKLGNYVWEDIDQDGIQNGSEPPIEGVKVTLTGTGNNGTPVMRMMFTGPDGMYMFDGLLPGTYKVTFDTPTGYTGTRPNWGVDDTVDSDADPTMGGMTQTVSLASGEYNPTLDAGFYLCSNIGDYVWHDVDHSGTQDAGETGVEGVQVKLLMAGIDGIFCTADDILKDEVTTGPNGEYLFECVTPGEYVVSFMNLPTDWTFSTANLGPDDALDSDADPTTGKTAPFTVTYGQPDDLTIDAGIRQICNQFFGGGGEIANNGTQPAICPGETPFSIINISAPSGGSGPIEYMWMFSTIDVPFDTTYWKAIPGAPSTLDYQPGPLNVTTWFIRCARRLDCDYFVESNTVKICVKDPQDCPAPFTADALQFGLEVYNGEDVQLNWEMGPERDNYNFFVERSFDGVFWSEIGNRSGKGDHLAGNYYDYLDRGPRKGVNFYRIRVVGLTTGINYSHEERILISDDILAKLYPNPFVDRLSLAPVQSWESDGTIELFDIAGRRLATYSLSRGKEIIELQLGKITSSGVYLVRITYTDSGKTTTFKVKKD